ncbi:helix-turn-helix domain-containing protein [Pilimelia anulata]
MGGFGRALRQRRKAAHLSQPDLAAKVRWSQSRISRAESGEALPTEDIAARLDDVLAAGGELRALWEREAAERDARKSARRDIGVNERSVGESDRRQLLAVAGAITFGAPLPEPAREIIREAFVRDEPTRVGHADVARVEAATRDLEQQDHSAGGAAVRHRVLGELQWAMTLLGGSCLPGVRQRLQVAIAYLADLAAWSTADAGHIDPARKLFLLGLRAARESGDPGILMHVATGYARVEIQSKDPKAALDLSRLARAGDGNVPGSAVSMLHTVQGLALAWLPDGQSCRDTSASLARCTSHRRVTTRTGFTSSPRPRSRATRARPYMTCT